MFLLQEFTQGAFVSPPKTLVDFKSRVLSVERVKKYPNTHFVMIPGVVGVVFVLSSLKLFLFAVLFSAVYFSMKVREPSTAEEGEENVMTRRVGYGVGVVVMLAYMYYSGLFYVFIQWGYVTVTFIVVHLLMREVEEVPEPPVVGQQLMGGAGMLTMSTPVTNI